jgi:hypothetical protein
MFLPLPFVPVLTLGPLLAILIAPRQMCRRAADRPLAVILVGFGVCWAAMAVITLLSERRLGMLAASLGEFSLSVLWVPWSALSISWAAARMGGKPALILAALSGGVVSLFEFDDRGNNFKYHYGLWLVLILLLFAWRSWRMGVVVVVLAATMSSIYQVRHLVVLLLLAMVLNLCVRGRRLRLAAVAGGAGAALITVLLVLQMSLSGWFGSAIQTITRSQAPDGSLATLLVSARPEGPANLSLIAADPLGGNWGAQLTSVQMWLVTRAFISVDRDPNASYIQDYLLSPTRPELHSITADSWLYGGVAGFAVVAILLSIFVRGLGWGMGDRSFFGVTVLFMSMKGIWDLAFSPLSDLQFDVLYVATILYAMWSSPSGEELAHTRAAEAI